MLEQLDTDQTRRKIGRFAWVTAWVGLAAGQLHALARFATADGREDLQYPLTAAWAVPASNLLRPLLDLAHPNLVYLHYGKVWFVVFAAFTLCAWVVYRTRRPTGFETWTWRLALTGYAVATVGVFASYWTQWTPVYSEPWFSIGWYLDVPGLLLSLAGSSLLGTTLLIKRFRPVLPALLLAAAFPMAVVIVQGTSLGSVSLPLAFAFGLLGRRIARATDPWSPLQLSGGGHRPAVLQATGRTRRRDG
jgi:hypothetical protein